MMIDATQGVIMSGPAPSRIALSQLLAESGTQALAEASSYRSAARDRLTHREDQALSAHVELAQVLIQEAYSILFEAADSIIERLPVEPAES
jgi:hypothetical protein